MHRSTLDTRTVTRLLVLGLGLGLGLATGCDRRRPAAPPTIARPPATPAAAVDAAVIAGDAATTPADAAPPDPAAAATAADLAAVRAIDERLDADRLDDAALRATVAALTPAEQRLLARLGACDGAMVAAELRASAGEPGLVPRRDAAATPAALTRALCLVAGLDRASRQGYLRDFLPPTGEVEIFHEVCPGDPPLVRGDRRAVSRATVRGDELPRGQRANGDGCVGPASAPRCGFVADNRSFDFTFQIVDGELYLASIVSNPMTGCY